METRSKLYLRIIGLILLLIPIMDLTINGHCKDLVDGFNNGKADICNYNFDVIPQNHDLSDSFPKINGKIYAQKIQLEVETKEVLDIIPFYNWGLYVVLAVSVIICLLSLFRLIKRFIRGELFEISTYNTLLYFGFSVLVITVVNFILEIIKRQQLLKYIDQKLYKLPIGDLFDIDGLFIGLFVLAFAIALKQSIAIKQENDLTV